MADWSSCCNEKLGAGWGDVDVDVDAVIVVVASG